MWKKFHRKHASNISNQHLTGLTEVQIYYKLSTILATQLVKGLTTNAPPRKFWKLSALGAILRVPEQIWGTSEIFSRVIFVRIIHLPLAPPPPLAPPSRGGGVPWHPWHPPGSAPDNPVYVCYYTHICITQWKPASYHSNCHRQSPCFDNRNGRYGYLDTAQWKCQIQLLFAFVLRIFWHQSDISTNFHSPSYRWFNMCFSLFVFLDLWPGGDEASIDVHTSIDVRTAYMWPHVRRSIHFLYFFL